ncbi:DUF2982 domain-containing protein [Vibrio sp. M260118]|uniref:DUF2982 domain-containing protein n=1 Tax=Vibrio sp. M260118 TaxID=3020896 RepID=UPI002F41E454
METVHLTNQPFVFSSITVKWISGMFALGCLFLLLYAPGWQQALLTAIAIVMFVGFGYVLILKGTVKFTLTATHFQQHLFKGGWVVKWSNIEKIGICTYQKDGWHQPLPWIGIKLKHYSPYLTSICPRIATEILLSQRALLYLGARQHQQGEQFQDIVLDSHTYQNSHGQEFTGLLAMLANRMKHQRNYYDYDIFISANDLDRPAEEFVGLARRYLAAADTTNE